MGKKRKRLLFPLCICISYIFPLILAYKYNETEVFKSFLGAFFLVGLIVFIFYFLFYNKDFRFRYNSLTLKIYFMWLITGGIYAFPLIIYGLKAEADFSFVDTYFYVFLALTATGSSELIQAYSYSHTLIFWLGFLQWLGGGLTIASFLLLYHAQKRNPVFTEQLFFLRSYVLVTLVVIVSFWLLGVGGVDATILAFSSVSLGSIIPTQQSIYEYYGFAVTVVFLLYIILFSLPFFIFLIHIRRSNLVHSQAVKFFESVRLSFLWFFCIFLLVSVDFFSNGYEAWNVLFFHIANLISISTTSGVRIAYIPEQDNTLFISIIFLVIFVGAHQATAAGGIKIDNIIILKNMIIKEVLRVFYHKNHIDFEKEEDDVYRFAFVNFFGFMIFIFLGALVISLEGENFFSSIMLSLGYLTNTDNALFSMSTEFMGSITYHAFTKCFLIALMIVGRLEIVVFIVYFTKYYWREKNV